MSARNNAWFIENADSREQFMSQARSLRQQADALLVQAHALELDASDLPKSMEMFEGQAITVTRETIPDGRVFLHFGSLPRQRRAQVYECANKPGQWAGNLEAFSSGESTRTYDSRVYTGGFFLGFHRSEAELTEIAKRWVAFGEIPQDTSR